MTKSYDADLYLPIKERLISKLKYLNNYGSMEIVTQDKLEAVVGGSILDEILYEFNYPPEEDLEWKASSILLGKYEDLPARIEVTHLPSGKTWWFPSEIYVIEDEDLQDAIYGCSTVSWEQVKYE